jgi:bleomycin hydrolase
MMHTSGPLYYNLPIDDLVTYSELSIKKDTPVWFASDDIKFIGKSHGLFGPTFFEDGNQNLLNKRERLEMLDSAVTHSMVLRGVSYLNNDIDKWSIENSWGQHCGPFKGYFICDHQWFKEYVYQTVIHRRFIKKIRKGSPIKKLPLWDPFGHATQTKLLKIL